MSSTPPSSSQRLSPIPEVASAPTETEKATPSSVQATATASELPVGAPGSAPSTPTTSAAITLPANIDDIFGVSVQDNDDPLAESEMVDVCDDDGAPTPSTESTEMTTPVSRQKGKGKSMSTIMRGKQMPDLPPPPRRRQGVTALERARDPGTIALLTHLDECEREIKYTQTAMYHSLVRVIGALAGANKPTGTAKVTREYVTDMVLTDGRATLLQAACRFMVQYQNAYDAIHATDTYAYLDPDNRFTLEMADTHTLMASEYPCLTRALVEPRMRVFAAKYPNLSVESLTHPRMPSDDLFPPVQTPRRTAHKDRCEPTEADKIPREYLYKQYLSYVAAGVDPAEPREETHVLSRKSNEYVAQSQLAAEEGDNAMDGMEIGAVDPVNVGMAGLWGLMDEGVTSGGGCVPRGMAGEGVTHPVLFPSVQHPLVQHPQVQHPPMVHPLAQHPPVQHPQVLHPSAQHPPVQHPPFRQYSGGKGSGPMVEESQLSSSSSEDSQQGASESESFSESAQEQKSDAGGRMNRRVRKKPTRFEPYATGMIAIPEGATRVTFELCRKR